MVYNDFICFCCPNGSNMYQEQYEHDDMNPHRRYLLHSQDFTFAVLIRPSVISKFRVSCKTDYERIRYLHNSSTYSWIGLYMLITGPPASSAISAAAVVERLGKKLI